MGSARNAKNNREPLIHTAATTEDINMHTERNPRNPQEILCAGWC